MVIENWLTTEKSVLERVWMSVWSRLFNAANRYHHNDISINTVTLYVLLILIPVLTIRQPRCYWNHESGVSTAKAYGFLLCVDCYTYWGVGEKHLRWLGADGRIYSFRGWSEKQPHWPCGVIYMTKGCKYLKEWPQTTIWNHRMSSQDD